MELLKVTQVIPSKLDPNTLNPSPPANHCEPFQQTVWQILLSNNWSPLMLLCQFIPSLLYANGLLPSPPATHMMPLNLITLHLLLLKILILSLFFL